LERQIILALLCYKYPFLEVQMPANSLKSIRKTIRENMLADEATAVTKLAKAAALTAEDRKGISARAAGMVKMVRNSSDPRLMESFLAEYGLSSREGVALMCLAEALLRVPDAETMDDLIRDKIAPHDWSTHSGHSSSIFVNASTWALALTGRVLDEGDVGIERTLRAMVRRLGEPVIRTAVARAMREMGEQFVLGQTISEAMKNGKASTAKGYYYSFDMLGEAARTDSDARRYHKAYADAIAAIAKHCKADSIRANPGISVKLSAIHPRYEYLKREETLPVLSSRLLELCELARDAGMGLNIDAEEADRLDLSLDVIENVLSSPNLKGWDGLGVVVQAYGPRAFHVLDWLHALAVSLDRRIMVRLVKGAYWDTEIKRAQTMGLEGFPVFTRKVNTDVSYISCARKLFSMVDRIYPQFATHNAHTAAAILAMAPNKECFEFQRLHGMGETLHEVIRESEGTHCRIYAPVGAHEDLLAYLVRRLLENGANSSFVHQIVDEAVSPETIARDPFEVALGSNPIWNEGIERPSEIFGKDRKNSHGWDITDPVTVAALDKALARFAPPHQWQAAPITTAKGSGAAIEVRNPARPDEIVGTVRQATAEQARAAVKIAGKAQGKWAATPVSKRSAILRKAADLYEANATEFFAIATREAGKILLDGVGEVREAVDFLRYYALQAEDAEHGTQARGVITCISPWNFPLAIFTGQVAAALATGNAVVAKPAEQTPLIAAFAVKLMHEAGVPADVLHLLPGDGPTVGAALVSDPAIAGVCFTGSTEVAKLIDRQLAENAAPDAMLIAETGGLNAMIVDSTALPEQAVRDVLASAFQSAGQRCSALRILYVQKDVEERITRMLKGAMAELKVGDPWKHETDVGPLIDDEAQSSIAGYCAEKEKEGKLIARLDAPNSGRFVPPQVFMVNGIDEMDREIFGPVLHLATYEAEKIDNVINAINARGYGLTFGLHTRIEDRVQHIVDGIHAGNIYVNRNQIGAIVGSQPFGGEGLSGTGPKAGGPLYLRRFRKAATNGAAPAAANGEGVDGAALRFDFPDDWATRTDRVSKLREALRGKAKAALSAAAALDHGPVDLPGPTGEANTLSLAARGNVLCLGATPEILLDQVVQALAAGNSVLAIAPGASKALATLAGKGYPLVIVEGTLDAKGIAALPIDAVAAVMDSADLSTMRLALSGRDGPIVPLITERINPAAYVHERAVCVDTTAAGGNASLLASAA
jgi:RHH-type proline utilization regulon transcriptional repressor/proline dehydrogenase/delta 1-pyrroline-5-carboxylate dehydrogenase